jgi:hypothetical protein
MLGKMRPSWLQDCAHDRARWAFGGVRGLIRASTSGGVRRLPLPLPHKSESVEAWAGCLVDLRADAGSIDGDGMAALA